MIINIITLKYLLVSKLQSNFLSPKASVLSYIGFNSSYALNDICSAIKFNKKVLIWGSNAISKIKTK